MLAASLADRDSIVQTAAARARRLGRPVLASTTRPAPPVDLLDAYAAADSRERAVWLRPDSDTAFVGTGAAAVIGDMSVGDTTPAWRELLAESVVDDPSSICGPLLMGAVTFDPPAARLVLPRETLIWRDGASWLTSNVLIDGWGRALAPANAPRLTTSGARAGLDPVGWRNLVGTTARGIREGRLDLTKVVLARAEHVRLPVDFREQQALRRLARAYPTCTSFAISDGDATFLGATPERLVRLQQGVASTVALAGSAPRGASDLDDERLARALLADPKERLEHDLVVQAVLDCLRAVGGRPVADAEPIVKRLPNVQHLLTEVRAQVPAGVSLLDLVASLHPTPAVGGLPREVALDYLRALEQLDRGWYAGAVGWVDSRGDGEFVVGIRSGLVCGGEATLFAGCGIVADSDPRAEYAEWQWKLRPMLAALGVAAD